MKLQSKTTIEIDGERFEMTANESGANQSAMADHIHMMSQAEGMYKFQDGNKFHQINVIGYDKDSHTYSIEMEGQLKQVRIYHELDLMIEKMGLNTIHSKKLSLMEAPMPGLVTIIKVAAGDHVDKGTPLLILEAMKMENVIAAPHDAIIKEIKVNIGQAVDRGFPLVEFE
ncbi:MAG: acetyl-CoA carboxylase biotin carboxyl carrier protein subunit [Saprospiraceae bacterium]